VEAKSCHWPGVPFILPRTGCGVLPVLVTVTALGALVVLTIWLPNSTEVGFIEKDSPGMNVTVALLAGGGVVDGAVEEKHAARQKPRTNTVKSRIMIVPFCDRNEDFRFDALDRPHPTPGRPRLRENIPWSAGVEGRRAGLCGHRGQRALLSKSGWTTPSRFMVARARTTWPAVRDLTDGSQRRSDQFFNLAGNSLTWRVSK
jgi:hypothetical protein